MWGKTFSDKMSNVDLKLIKLKTPKQILNLKDSEPWMSIAYLYGRPEYIDRFAATLLNAMFTANKKELLLSKRIFQDMLTADDNVERKTVNTDEFAKFMAKIISNGTLKKIKDWSFDQNKKKGQAGLYELCDLELLRILVKQNTDELQIVSTKTEA